MTNKECILSRRSVRKFSDKKIDAEVLKDIINVSTYAPSWKNSQITRYIAVSGSAKDQIALECTSEHPNNKNIINSSPTLMVITAVKKRSGYDREGNPVTKRIDGWQMYDSGIASQTFCLACHENGIGSVILGIFDNEKVASILNLDENLDVIALIPIGYPNEVPIAPKRKTADELLTFIS